MQSITYPYSTSSLTLSISVVASFSRNSFKKVSLSASLPLNSRIRSCRCSKCRGTYVSQSAQWHCTQNRAKSSRHRRMSQSQKSQPSSPFPAWYSPDEPNFRHDNPMSVLLAWMCKHHDICVAIVLYAILPVRNSKSSLCLS